ncbi:UDP-glucose/GDP-mannose dehydrogenase family protein [Bacillus sp. FJAT-47783]|uniref:UDP-glucose dehydrogenase family protein n=1 Tax=Bacillus sp. FJAT-47783 TaxID=2922712 RepID=UPI001FAC6E06|nr:UDP-glucose/GDP-mannose dehydrogenase family protein [Bacillus sp. FJAT-47783]
MRVAVAGTGYVGLVTGVCLSEVGHEVTCIDIDKQKIDMLVKGKSPIYEPGLDELIQKNMKEKRLTFTTESKVAYNDKEIIIIAVGTPENEDGSANLTYIKQVVKDILSHINGPVTLVTKSTVPVGTNDTIKQWVNDWNIHQYRIDIASNPEFLREGSAIDDTFYGDRIVIGADSPEIAHKVAKLYEPFNIPIIKTGIRSAEMIKYAANAFLATKISFINEIANICEKVGANIEDVANGIGTDKRIGPQFLKAGIGYGGSCFPKDTKALVQIAGNVQHKFELLEAVIRVNHRQQMKLVKKAKEVIGSLQGKRCAILGLAFKPNTDDVREAASLVMAKQLLDEGATVIAYDPIAIDNAKDILGDLISYTNSIEEAIKGADLAFIATEWDEVKKFPVNKFTELMSTPNVLDGRNCYSFDTVKKFRLNYYSVGRK